MLVLIIEDDSQKAERVKSSIADARPQAEIVICRSYQSGLRWLSEKDSQPDVVVLDMSLPTFDPTPDQRQGRPRPLGGYDLMRKMRRQGLRARIVVLTALENFGSRTEQITLDELAQRCRQEFEGMFTGIIHYSQSETGWRSQLISSIEDSPC